MQIAELKLEIFRKIDQLSEKELFSLYAQIREFLNASGTYQLNKQEEKAIEEAEAENQRYSHDQIVAEANAKYPNLDMK